jgi:hypothetical protein
VLSQPSSRLKRQRGKSEQHKDSFSRYIHGKPRRGVAFSIASPMVTSPTINPGRKVRGFFSRTARILSPSAKPGSRNGVGLTSRAGDSFFDVIAAWVSR